MYEKGRIFRLSIMVVSFVIQIEGHIQIVGNLLIGLDGDS